MEELGIIIATIECLVEIYALEEITIIALTDLCTHNVGSTVSIE